MSARRPSRTWLAIGLALVIALCAAVWTGAGDERYPDDLDPRNPGPDGAQAVAEVLDDEGVDVEIVRSAAALEETTVDAGTTVLVTSTSALSPGTLRRLREHAAPGRLVLVEPSYALVQEIDEAWQATASYPDGLRADCSGTPDVDLGGLEIQADQVTVFSAGTGQVPGTTCFPTSGGAVVVDVPAQDLLLFGAGEALSNDQVLRGDNAAVALRTLGASGHLVWYVPDPTDATADEAVTLSSLLPDWIGPGLWTGALALITLVLWRVRRLGPLSTEPLPVVVRAVETARSRGRLYRRSGDRAHAAQALRRAARDDLASRLGLDRRAEPAAVVDAASRHLGIPAEHVAALLTDHHLPPPASDQDLVRLAQELDRFRREVRRG